MNGICPYCRAAVDSNDANGLFCSGCGTPHHVDCFEENGGCTVFGCSSAPSDEPKLQLSPEELSAAAGVRTAAPGVTGRRPAPPPPLPGQPTSAEPMRLAVGNPGSGTLFGVPVSSPDRSIFYTTAPRSVAETPEGPELIPKNRMTFITLGVLLGFVGAHNYYAGYKGKALAQMLITVVTLGIGGPMSWVWAVIDVCTVDRDNRGVRFES